MSTATSISLFNETRLTRRGPSAVALSALFHGAGFALLFIGITLTPPIVERQHPDHYILRLLTLHSPEEQARQAAADAAKYPGEQPKTEKAPAGGSPAAQQPAPKLDSVRRQTLVQPDVPPQVKLPDNVQLPQVVAWQKPKVVLKEIVPDAPKIPAATQVKPSIDVPNEEVDLADVRISSTPFVAESLALQPRTTSPIVNQAEKPNDKIPETASKADKAAPAQVVSLSDMNMPQGTTALPFANQLASGAGSLAPGIGKDPSQGNAHGPSDAKGAGSGGSGNKSGAASGSGADAMNGTTHIHPPKDGHFGMVVVGTSLEEMYPETAGVWGNRISYTVYMSMGTAKKWIMQYSVPRGEEATTGGKTAPPEAPYPTDIVRPNLAPGEINADALMVHGFVNEDGKFEKLSVSFPPDFPRAKFVIDALNQWQFRPALQLGLPIRVEVLLIIPETYD
jgi:hypothetical protein